MERQPWTRLPSPFPLSGPSLEMLQLEMLQLEMLRQTLLESMIRRHALRQVCPGRT